MASVYWWEEPQSHIVTSHGYKEGNNQGHVYDLWLESKLEEEKKNRNKRLVIKPS